MSTINLLKWMDANRLEFFTGITKDAANTNISKGIWHEGIHWRKAPNNRRFFNYPAIQSWIEGKEIVGKNGHI